MPRSALDHTLTTLQNFSLLTPYLTLDSKKMRPKREANSYGMHKAHGTLY